MDSKSKKPSFTTCDLFAHLASCDYNGAASLSLFTTNGNSLKTMSNIKDTPTDAIGIDPIKARTVSNTTAISPV